MSAHISTGGQIPPEPRSSATTSQDRRIQMLRTAMGPLIAAALEDPDVVEIMLNPDRTLWVDRLSSGRAPLGVELPEADGERILRSEEHTSELQSLMRISYAVC